MRQPRHTARGLVLHDDKILLMERWREGRHYFSIPGGGIEPKEMPEETVVRELLEETGCTVAVERQVYDLTFADGAENKFFLCRYVSGEPHLPADSPEAKLNGSENRFRPAWFACAQFSELPLAVWEPIRQQLVHDLEFGFGPDIVAIPPAS